MKNLLDGAMADAKSLLLGGLIIMAIAFVIMTWARTRSLVPTVGAVLLGVVIIAGVNSYTTIQREVEEDITRYTETDNSPVGGG